MAGGSYLRISLYVLMIHFKKFGTFIRSVPISRLSNWTSREGMKSKNWRVVRDVDVFKILVQLAPNVVQ